MNLIEYLYPLVCNNINFILFLIVTIVINDFRCSTLQCFFTVNNKYFDNDFWNVKSKY